MEKLIVTLNVSELKDIIAETIEAKMGTIRLVPPIKSNIELPKFMKRQEVANFFRVSLVTIDKWRRYGLLPKTIKQSGRTYFLRKDVEKLVEDKVSMANLKKS
jgi:hypothetical protein